MSKQLYLLTSNIHKYNELKLMLGARGYKLRLISHRQPEIQASCLKEVVKHKLQSFRPCKKRQIITDDSGLFIEALNGFPGVFSAFVFKTIGCAGVLKLMKGERNRRANFVCCIGYLKDGKINLFKGVCSGHIAFAARGEHGFGFDPIFISDGEHRTFAQLSTEQKNRLSHRARAIAKFIAYLERDRDKNNI